VHAAHLLAALPTGEKEQCMNFIIPCVSLYALFGVLKLFGPLKVVIILWLELDLIMYCCMQLQQY
jgi:hypothetical protein